METLTPHTFEPAVSGPPPRHLSPPPGQRLLVGLALLLFALLLCGSVGALLQAAKLSWVGLTGQRVVARITAIETVPGTAGSAPAIQTAVHYAVRDALHPSAFVQTGTLTLGPSAAPQSTPLAPIGPLPARTLPTAQFHVGEMVTLRRARWLGQTLLLPWPSDPGGKIAFLAFCGALLAAVCGLLIRKLWQWSAGRAFLLKHGVATVGTITHKRAQAEDAALYFVRYGYGDTQSPPSSFEHEEQVTPGQWKRLEVGQPVTVLYDPARPDVSGLYTLLRGL